MADSSFDNAPVGRPVVVDPVSQQEFFVPAGRTSAQVLARVSKLAAGELVSLEVRLTWAPSPFWINNEPVDPISLPLSDALAIEILAWFTQWQHDPETTTHDPKWQETGSRLADEAEDELFDDYVVVRKF